MGERGNHVANVPVYLDEEVDEDGEEGFFCCFFSSFVICHSTKNVHGNYKQTSQ